MANRYPDGGRSALIIGYETDTTGSPIKQRSQMVQKAFAFNSWSVNEASETEESAAIRASRAASPPGEGRLWSEGSADFQMTLTDMHDWWASLLWSESPSSTALTNKTLITTQDLEETVTLVDAVTLTSASVSIDDDLADYTQEATLNVTLAGSPALASGGTPGTVVLTFSDGSTEPLSFASGALTTAQTTTLAGTLGLDMVTLTGFSAGTVSITADIATIERPSYWQEDTLAVVINRSIDVTNPRVIADDLSEYFGEIELEISLTDSPALTTASTPGTITLTYTDEDDVETTEVVSIPNAELGDLHTATRPAKTTITEVVARGFNAGNLYINAKLKEANGLLRASTLGKPGRLAFTFSDALAAGSKIVISGYRRAGLDSRDTLLQEETISGASGTSATSTKFYHTLRSVRVLDPSNNPETDGTVTVVSQPQAWETKFNLSDELNRKLTIEADLATIPTRVESAVVTGATITVGSPNSLSLTFIGSRLEQYRTIEGADVDQFRSTRAQHESEFPLITERFYPSWGGYVEIDGQVLIFTGATITLDQGAQLSEGIQGSRFRRDIETLTRSLTVSLDTFFYTGTTAADTFTNWQTKFRDRAASEVNIVMHHWPVEGRQYSTEFDMKNVIVTAPVPLDISDRGRVARTIELSAYPTTGGSGTDDLEIRVTGPEQWS